MNRSNPHFVAPKRIRLEEALEIQNYHFREFVYETVEDIALMSLKQNGGSVSKKINVHACTPMEISEEYPETVSSKKSMFDGSIERRALMPSSVDSMYRCAKCGSALFSWCVRGCLHYEPCHCQNGALMSKLEQTYPATNMAMQLWKLWQN